MAATISYDNATRLPLTLSGAYLLDSLDDDGQHCCACKGKRDTLL
jgi:hypothetical protein